MVVYFSFFSVEGIVFYFNGNESARIVRYTSCDLYSLIYNGITNANCVTQTVVNQTEANKGEYFLIQ